MLRRILIGLGGSDESRSALELGLRWATRRNAEIVGLAIVDDPGTQFIDEFVAEESRPATSSARPVSPAHDWFIRRCEEAGVKCLVREAMGSPHLRILAEVQRHDLVLMGQRSHFEYGWEGVAGETLAKLMPACPRPVITVPDVLTGSESVVIAFDGSLPAARALAAFEATGLGLGQEVHVVSVGPNRQEAAERADRAVDFLTAHGIEARPDPVETDSPPAEAILRKVVQAGAGLLVMGANGHPVFREFVFGSVTRSVLKTCSVPVFVFQ